MNIRTLATLLAGALFAATPAAAQGPQAGQHTITTPAAVQWGPAPDALPPGAQLAVLDGDPGKPGMYSIRVKFPDGYRVPPHWHPGDEHILVLQGQLRLNVGEGGTMTHVLPVGAYGKMPAKVAHEAIATGETILQLYGPGPFDVVYLNPKDDPRKKTRD